LDHLGKLDDNQTDLKESFSNNTVHLAPDPVREAAGDVPNDLAEKFGH